MLNIELKYSVTDIYFRFIQFSLGIYEGKEFLDGSALKGLDWNTFYEFAKKQTLVGVVFDDIQKLLKDVAPNLELLMRWFGINQKIMQRNNVLNEATVAIYNKVEASGYSCCILKGQGNAVMFPSLIALNDWMPVGSLRLLMFVMFLFSYVQVGSKKAKASSLNPPLLVCDTFVAKLCFYFQSAKIMRSILSAPSVWEKCRRRVAEK